MLTVDELLAGGSLTYTVAVPETVLNPQSNDQGALGSDRTVQLQPLTVQDLQVIARAAKENDSLTATLMVQRALVEPALSVAQVAALHVGLVQFLLDQVNQISGITTSAEQLSTAMEAPLTRAAFVLAKSFGWTPQQVSELTLGQILLHLQMLKENP
ncbi:hypothetical protein ACQ4N7_19740 [Nodosilinea sp. AN01ver1]|uniref:hypothetical protein n=1 Tax=Nodosilinea sp. AN01ver1 TaxID=3423362 RepID=UPI003D31BBF2